MQESNELPESKVLNLVPATCNSINRILKWYSSLLYHYMNSWHDSRWPRSWLEWQDLIAKYVPDNKYLNDSKKIVPPTSAANSLTRDDNPLWDYAMKAEYAEFERLKVHSKPMTLAECRAQGYHMQSYLLQVRGLDKALQSTLRNVMPTQKQLRCFHVGGRHL